MRTGRLPYSPLAVALAPSLARHPFAAAEPVTMCDRSAINYQPQMRHNQDLPTCTVAGLINAALAAEALNAGSGLAIAADCELPFYASIAGCAATVDAIAATDGLNVLDVLRRQSTAGFDIGVVS